MKNPWIQKNPFMSLWLSGANTLLGQARNQATTAVRREANKAVTAASNTAARQVADFWTAALTPPSSARKRRKTP